MKASENPGAHPEQSSNIIEELWVIALSPYYISM